MRNGERLIPGHVYEIQEPEKVILTTLTLRYTLDIIQRISSVYVPVERDFIAEHMTLPVQDITPCHRTHDAINRDTPHTLVRPYVCLGYRTEVTVGRYA